MRLWRAAACGRSGVLDADCAPSEPLSRPPRRCGDCSSGRGARPRILLARRECVRGGVAAAEWAAASESSSDSTSVWSSADCGDARASPLPASRMSVSPGAEATLVS